MSQRSSLLSTAVDPEFMSMVQPLGGSSSERIDTAGFSFPQLLLFTLAVLFLLLPMEAVTAGAASGAASAATISGKALFAETGKPADGVTVRISGRGGWMEERETDRTGSYSFTGIRPGTYEISFYAKAAAVKNALPEFAPVILRNITVQAGQLLRNTDVRLVRGGIVTGRVTKADTGGPVSGARIFEYDGRATVASTDRNGVYRMRIAPGRARISLGGPAPDGYAFNPTPRPVEVRAGDTVDGIDFRFRKIITVTGSVLSPEGTPVEGVTVTARRNDPSSLTGAGSGAVSGSNGMFLLENMIEGEPVTLYAEKEKAGLRGGMQFIPHSEKGTAVWKELVIRMERYTVHDVEGRVVDEKGRPVDMAKVSFAPLNGKSSSDKEVSNSGAYANSMGRFRLIGLEVGKNYRITIEAKGYRKLEKDLLPVTSHTTVLNDFVLRKAPQ